MACSDAHSDVENGKRRVWKSISQEEQILRGLFNLSYFSKKPPLALVPRRDPWSIFKSMEKGNMARGIDVLPNCTCFKERRDALGDKEGRVQFCVFWVGVLLSQNKIIK